MQQSKTITSQHVVFRDEDDDNLGLIRPSERKGHTSHRCKHCLVCSCCCAAICVIFATSLITIIYFSLLFAFPIRDPDLQWDWKKINTSDIYFPSNFVFGSATAAHQGS